MSGNRHGLRSRSAAKSLQPPIPPPSVCPISFTSSPSPSATSSIQIIAPGSKLPGLSPKELKLLRQKQTRLETTTLSTLEALPPGAHIRNALESTLIFAQYEAGTAVCIDAAGWILTCSHCFGEDEEERQTSNKRRWLLYYTGLAVQVECRVWDSKRDLALLKVIAIETRESPAGTIPIFPYIPLSTKEPSYKVPILCFGQPGRDDLESTSARKTQYNLVEVSEGTFRGMVKGADPQDNSEIGVLMHDAWTYWGHSGAPLVSEKDGTLVGMHSSWDDQTAMRHGIPRVAVLEFLEKNLSSALALAASSGG